MNEKNWGYSHKELIDINKFLEIYDFQLLQCNSEINKNSKNKHLRFRITNMKTYKQYSDKDSSTINYYYLGNKNPSMDEILFTILKFDRNIKMKITNWIMTHEELGEF